MCVPVRSRTLASSFKKNQTTSVHTRPCFPHVATLGTQITEEFRTLCQADLSGSKKAKQQKQNQVQFSLEQAKDAFMYCDHPTHMEIVKCLFRRVQDNARLVDFDFEGNVLEQLLGNSLEEVAAQQRGFEVRFQVGSPAHDVAVRAPSAAERCADPFSRCASLSPLQTDTMMLIFFCIGIYGLRSEVLFLMPIAAFASMVGGYDSFVANGRLDTEYMAVSTSMPHGVTHSLP